MTPFFKGTPRRIARDTGLPQHVARRVLVAHQAYLQASEFAQGSMTPKQVTHLRRKYATEMPAIHEGIPVYDAWQHATFIACLARVDLEVAVRVLLAEARAGEALATAEELEAMLEECKAARAN